jgi:hypothetical protein
MAEMTTGNKVALGVGITLVLAGVGVGLYFVFRKPKTEEQKAAEILSGQKPPLTLQDLQRQNPTMSNADLLKALGNLLKGSGSKPQSGAGSGGGGTSGTQTKPKPEQKPSGSYGQGGSGYDMGANDYAYNQTRDEGAYNDATYSLGGYGNDIPSDWSSYGDSGGGGAYGSGY